MSLSAILFLMIWIYKCLRTTSSSIKLSATGRLLDITYMCYEYRTPLFPAQLLQARQSDLSVTSIPQSVNRWRHNEYSWCPHPLHFVQASNTPVVKVRLVVWRSDLTGQGGEPLHQIWMQSNHIHKSWDVMSTSFWGNHFSMVILFLPNSSQKLIR